MEPETMVVPRGRDKYCKCGNWVCWEWPPSTEAESCVRCKQKKASGEATEQTSHAS